MNVVKDSIAELLRRYAAVLSLEGVDRFRVKAYPRAAEAIPVNAPRETAARDTAE